MVLRLGTAVEPEEEIKRGLRGGGKAKHSSRGLSAVLTESGQGIPALGNEQDGGLGRPRVPAEEGLETECEENSHSSSP